MAMMQKSGLTPHQIILTGARNVGDYFKSKDNFGTIALGKRADLILIDGDPLKDITNVARLSGVMVRGRWLPQAEIQQRLEKIAAAYKSNAG
jgi:imidazolonepropionase-like amidohydrolase